MQFQFADASLIESCGELRARVRAFLRAEQEAGRLVPRPNSWIHFDADFSRRCGENGFIGITFPVEYGGAGGTAIERYVMCEEMLAAGAPVGMHWIADRQSGPQILRFGSDAAKRSILPEIAAGRCCIGIGMSEPGAGSDLAAVRTRGIRVDGGWRITGQKLWTTNAQNAHYVIALIRTGDSADGRHAGLTQMVVDMRSDGLRVSPIRDISGGRDFNEVFFDDVFVPDEYLLGAAGEGWKLVTGELAYERSGPERFMSTFPLFEALAGKLGPEPDRDSARALGRLVSHFLALRRMSNSIAGMMARGVSPDVEAALVKDVGSAFERDLIDVARRHVALPPDVGAEDDYQRVLAQSLLAAPSFTLRGGTREILRGIVAREITRP